VLQLLLIYFGKQKTTSMSQKYIPNKQMIEKGMRVLRVLSHAGLLAKYDGECSVHWLGSVPLQLLTLEVGYQ
jgi:hypothetical protein